jgi:predicted phosphodiesterase
MRAWIFSDLHLDVNRAYPFRLPEPRPAHDVVIIAGDVREGMASSVRWIVEQGLNEHPVIFVGGNHEFYRYDRHRELAEGRTEAERHRNIHLLECDVITIGEVLFIGATLWTDYALFADIATAKAHAAFALNDHRLIRTERGPWTPQDCGDEHLAARAFIRRQLDQSGDRKAVVVTHHGPSLKSIAPRYRQDVLSAAFASDCERLGERAALWVHGHVHSQARYQIGDCRVVCNPRGYVRHGEDAGFDPALVVEVT